MTFRLLLALKFKLLTRSLARRPTTSKVRTVSVGFVVVAGAVGICAAFTRTAFRAGGDPQALAAGFASLHLGWLAASVLMGAFAEGFELGPLLHLPVDGRAVFWLNILVAPLDVTGLFILPPLGAMAAGAAVAAGPWAGLGVALAGAGVLLTSAALAQGLLAALTGGLRQDWTRALLGLVCGVGFLIPTILVGRQVASTSDGEMPPLLRVHTESRLAVLGTIGRWWPTSAAPVRAATAALAGNLGSALLWLGLTGATLFLVVRLGSQLALGQALAGPRLPHRSRVSSPIAERLAGRLVTRLLGIPIALLLQRELRYTLRTPQIVVGLILAPLLTLAAPRFGSDAITTFALVFWCLVAALNLSANQFGLDQAGVKLHFLLPVSPRDVVAAKNLGIVVIVALSAVLVFGLAALAHRLPSLRGVGFAGLALAGALPPLLMTGNALSLAHPWRLKFKLGGAPPGALVSAMAQFGVLAALAVALAIPLFLVPELTSNSMGGALLTDLALSLFAAAGWTMWRASLRRAGERLYAQRERLIDRLAHGA